MTDRRTFLRLSSGSTLAIVSVVAAAQAKPAATPAKPATAPAASASGAAVLNEKDPQAVALGYVTDAKRADKAKFPKYAPPQHCAACQLYQGAPTAAMAPCAIFAGKQVAATGWCSAYTARQG